MKQDARTRISRLKHVAMAKQEINDYAAQLYCYLKEKRVGRKQCVADMLLKLAPDVDWYRVEDPDVMLAIEKALAAQVDAEGEFIMDSTGSEGMIIGLPFEIPFVFRKKS